MSVRNQTSCVGESDSKRRTPVRTNPIATASRQASLARIQARLLCAKAELASSPNDELLADFIRLNEALLAKERGAAMAVQASHRAERRRFFR